MPWDDVHRHTVPADASTPAPMAVDMSKAGSCQYSNDGCKGSQSRLRSQHLQPSSQQKSTTDQKHDPSKSIRYQFVQRSSRQPSYSSERRQNLSSLQSFHHRSLQSFHHRSTSPLQILYIARLCFLEGVSTLAGSRPGIGGDNSTRLDNDPQTDHLDQTNVQSFRQSSAYRPGNEVHQLSPIEIGLVKLPRGLHEISEIHSKQLPLGKKLSRNDLPFTSDSEFNFCNRVEDVWTRMSDESLEQLLGDCLAD